MKEHEKLQFKLEKAKEEKNPASIEALETELCYLEGAYKISIYSLSDSEQEN